MGAVMVGGALQLALDVFCLLGGVPDVQDGVLALDDPVAVFALCNSKSHDCSLLMRDPDYPEPRLFKRHTVCLFS